MLDLTENTHTIWFCTFNEHSLWGSRGDWLGQLDKTEQGGKLTFRFRYYSDSTARDPFDGKDEKHWFETKSENVESLYCATCDMVKLMKEMRGGQSWEIQRGTGTLDQLFEEFSKLPFVHMRSMTPEELQDGDITIEKTE